jgi:hypothetical protein
VEGIDEPASGERLEQPAVAAADLHQRPWPVRQGRRERRHVIGLALGAQRSPCPVALRIRAFGAVLVLVDVAQLGRARCGHAA